MRVMNVKFVGRIIMTILFVFICIGAYAGDDLLKYEIEGEELLARCICHELDHLDGHLYVEKVEGVLHDVTYEDTQE